MRNMKKIIVRKGKKNEPSIVIENLRCSRPTLHNFPNIDSDTKCEWCGKTIEEIKGYI